MKPIITYITESSCKKIKDDDVNLDELENAIKELADVGLNAAVAETTYKMASKVAKKLTGTVKSEYQGNYKNGKLIYPNLEKLLEKYFNKKEYKGEIYWFDKSRKSIDSWLHSDNKGTMENPNI